MLADSMFFLPIFTGGVVGDVRERYLLERRKSEEYLWRYGFGHLRGSVGYIGDDKNMMPRLIKIQRS